MAIDFPIVLPSDPGAQILLPTADDADVVTEGFDGSQQVQSYPGERWAFEVDYPPMTRDEAEELLGAFLACRKAGTFLLGPERGRNPRGSGGGVPYLVGPGSVSSTITIQGWPPNSEPLKPGDWIQISKNYAAANCRHFGSGWTSHNATVTAGAGAGGADRLTPTGSDAFLELALTPPLIAGRTFHFDISLVAVAGVFALDLMVANQALVQRGITHAVLPAAGSYGRFRVSGLMQSGDTQVALLIGGNGTWNVAQGAVDANVVSAYSLDGPDNFLCKSLVQRVAISTGEAIYEIYPTPHGLLSDCAGILVNGAKGVFRLAEPVSWSEDAVQYGLKIKVMEAY